MHFSVTAIIGLIDLLWCKIEEAEASSGRSQIPEARSNEAQND